MARIDVIMPQMGESIAEGTVVAWMKEVGAAVKRDEPLLEISTDKVDAEIPSPATGTLVEIRTAPGTTVAVGAVIAIIDDQPGASASAPRAAAPAPAKPAPAPARASAPPPVSGPGHLEATPVHVSPAAAKAQPPIAAPGARSAEELRRTKSSPLVRRIAREHAVDITRLSGSGLSGRVTKRDILAYLESGPPQQNGHAQAAQQNGLPASPPVAAKGPASSPLSPGDVVEAMTNIRQRTAENMVYSKHTNAHVTTVFEVDLTRVAKLRERHKASFASKHGVRLTFLPFIAKAFVSAVGNHPYLNASIQGPGAGKEIVWHRSVNLGIAVALGDRGDQGLIVPVIKSADERNFLGLCRAIEDLAGRARQKKLGIEEIQGGTISITNPGTFGSLFGTPIIPPPQSAILGVGAVVKRPVVITDTDDDGVSVDSIAIRSMVLLALSFDHRLIDGAVADKFMGEVKANLEGFTEAQMS